MKNTKITGASRCGDEMNTVTWTRTRPDRPGWWWYRHSDGTHDIMKVWVHDAEWVAGGFRLDGYAGLWSSTPIPEPQEGGK